jgi:hypothetical protein
LQANINQIVEVEVEGKTWISGCIDSVLMDHHNEKGLLILSDEKGEHAVPLSRILSVRMPTHPTQDSEREQQLQTKLTKHYEMKSLQIYYKYDNKESATSNDAILQYVARGISWKPTYRLEILDPNSKKANIKINAMVTNSEDLEANELMLAPRQNSIVKNDNIRDEKEAQLLKERISSICYTLKNVSLRGNDINYIPIFEDAIEYQEKNIFILSSDNKNDGRVWQAIQLKNKWNIPWSSQSPITIVNSQGIIEGYETLSRDILHGEDCFLKLNPTDFLRVEHWEILEDKKKRTEATFKVHNILNKDTSIVIVHRFGAIGLDDTQKVEGITYKVIDSKEDKGIIMYEMQCHVQLAPNETKIIKHGYYSP